MQQSFNKICRTMRSSCARYSQFHSPPVHPGKAMKPCCDTAPGHVQVDELLAMDADNEEYRDLQTSLVEVCDACSKLTSHRKGRGVPAECLQRVKEEQAGPKGSMLGQRLGQGRGLGLRELQQQSLCRPACHNRSCSANMLQTVRPRCFHDLLAASAARLCSLEPMQSTTYSLKSINAHIRL